MKALDRWLQDFVTELEPLHGPREARAVSRWYFAETLGLQATDFILRKEELFDLPMAPAHLAQLKGGMPVQLLVGKAYFLDLELRVTDQTLVPRPETEELVTAIAAQWKGRAPKILDLGTGSGCIALALKSLLPKAELWAWDSEEGALEVARTNGTTTGLAVHFEHRDMLGDAAWPACDVVVSNPPYIPQRERASMTETVVRYEPSTALFVPDEDPLLFYRAIAKRAEQHFSASGEVWVEIHEDFGAETCALFESFGAREVICHKDLQGKDRYIVARYGTS